MPPKEERGAGGCRAKGMADEVAGPALGASERSEESAPGLSPGASAGGVLLCLDPLAAPKLRGGKTSD